MSQIQRSAKKSIFAQQIQRTSTMRNDPSVVFFRRLNRPRNNTFNNVQLTKYLKLKYPIAAAILVTIGYDFAFHMYTDVPQGH